MLFNAKSTESSEITLETRGEDVEIHSKRVEKFKNTPETILKQVSSLVLRALENKWKREAADIVSSTETSVAQLGETYSRIGLVRSY